MRGTWVALYDSVQNPFPVSGHVRRRLEKKTPSFSFCQVDMYAYHLGEPSVGIENDRRCMPLVRPYAVSSDNNKSYKHTVCKSNIVIPVQLPAMIGFELYNDSLDRIITDLDRGVPRLNE